jgi:hypothetical protein
MKRNSILKLATTTCRFLFNKKTFLAFVASINFILHANDFKTTNKISFEDLISSAQTNNIYILNQIANDFETEHSRMASQLLDILKSKKTSNLNQCASAYYLGEIRNPESANALADLISLRLDVSKINLIGLPEILQKIGEYPAMNALIKIGNPSIPAVIRNLAESDDAKVRELSLKILYRIDGDKDIVKLRLQKALAAQKDSQKQARLQSALKALAETSFVN